MMRPQPYIGITGFKTAQEIRVANAICRNTGLLDGGYRPMYGFIATDNRLKEKGKGGDMSPSLDELPDLLRQSPRGALTMVHYHTQRPERTVEELTQVLEHRDTYAEGLCRAVQLNATWPEPDVIIGLKKRFPELQVVVSLTRKALSPPYAHPIKSTVDEYRGIADYVLIDPSGGTGQLIDAARAVDMLAWLEDAMPTTCFGIAGGLEGANVAAAIGEIKRLKHPACIDAQGRLRNAQGLDFRKMKDYITNAMEALR